MTNMTLAIDLNDLIPTNLELKIGKWTVTSPVPDTDTGRMIMAASLDAATFETTGAKISDETAQTLSNLPNLVFGEDQVEQLREDGMPQLVLEKARVYAAMYWLHGQEASDKDIDTRSKRGPKGRKH